MIDRYSAVWLSHSSISDFGSCPRAYFLKHVYRDPKNGHKIRLVSAPLSLGQAVHETIEEISTLPKEKRFDQPLMTRFEKVWQKFSGLRGGFANPKMESRYQQRGREMIARITEYPGPLKELAVKINLDLPHFWLSKTDNLILCGKIDWLEYLPDEDAVAIIDFKTGKGTEEEGSLQLPIYQLIAQECQERPVRRASFWYLDRQNYPQPVDLPNQEKTREKLIKIGKKIRLARQVDRFLCPQGDSGCPHCAPFEAVVSGQGELVGTDDFGYDLYFLEDSQSQKGSKSRLL